MVVVWAINYSVIKVGLGEIPPLAFNALRFVLASAVVWTVLRTRGPIPMPHAEDVWKLVALGVLVDTFVVRSLLVPGLVHDVGPRSWWPSALARRPEHGTHAAPTTGQDVTA